MKRRVASRSIRMINKHTDVWCWIFRTADHLKHQTCCSPEHITNAQHESQRAVSGTCRPSVLSHTVASGNEVALQRWQCWRRANSWLIAAAFFFPLREYPLSFILLFQRRHKPQWRYHTMTKSIRTPDRRTHVFVPRPTPKPSAVLSIWPPLCRYNSLWLVSEC